MNPSAPISGVVADVVKEVMGLGVTPSEKEKTKDKIKSKETTPRTLRTTEGAPPTISITPPKNVKEAREAYGQWRAARSRRMQGQ